MNYLKEALEYFTKFFQWWVIVMPWEQAVRVRFGKNAIILKDGIHFRIPFFDAIYIHSTRLRMINLNPQTLTTKDNLTVTIVTVVGYSISDVLKLHIGMYQPESTIANISMGAIAKWVFQNEIRDCQPPELETAAMNSLNANDYGIKYEYVKVTGYAIVKTYRLIQDGNWIPNELNTNNKL